MRNLKLLAAAVSVVLPSAAVAAEAAPAAVAPERWVVTFDRAAGLPHDLPRTLRRLGALDAAAFATIDTVAVTLPAGRVAALTKRGDVVAAHPERRLEFTLAGSVPHIGADRATLDRPETVLVPGPTGPEEVTRRPVDGSGQVVAVVDTGVWAAHPDLSSRVVASRNFELAYAAEMLLTPAQLDAFAEATGPLAGPGDDVGHGTHVAGIVAATGAGSRGRVNDNRGVAPGASLVDLRISPQAHTTDNNVGWERNALAAYDWLLRHHDDPEFGPAGIRVANNSWGVGPSTVDGEPLDYSAFGRLLPAADAAGISVVFAAGNSGTRDNVTDTLLPNGHPTVVTVAAGCKPGARSSGCAPTTPDRVATFSSRGPAVDVTAPGVDIVAPVNPSSGAVLGQLSGSFAGTDPADAVTNRIGYANFSGTSMAAPHVAGLVALMLETDPTLTPHDVRVILGATARDLHKAGRDVDSGYGLVRTREALIAATRHAAGTPVAVQFPGFPG